MKYQIFAIIAAVVGVVAQGVTDKVAPKAPAPDGCKPSVDGKFEVAILGAGNNAKRDVAIQKRGACSSDGILVAELKDSVITDAHQRAGYIASNYQFQFDAPPQAGAIYTAGFSHCQNGSLALGGSTVFYQCRSGNFYNLYDRYWAAQCSPVEIVVMPCDTEADGQSSNAGGGGQNVIGTKVITTTVVAPIGDGQPQVVTTTTAVEICQIGDGQIQGHTTPCTAVPPKTTQVPPVSQFSDGQIQVTTPVPPVSQISDGQIQATPVPSQASEGGGGGQVQATATPSAVASEGSQGQVHPTSSASSPLMASSLAQTTLRASAAGSSSAGGGAPTGAPAATAGAAGSRGTVGEMMVVAVVGAMAWGM